jgi:hypothetical protein
VLGGVVAAHVFEPWRVQGFDEKVRSAVFDSLAHPSGFTQEDEGKL